MSPGVKYSLHGGTRRLRVGAGPALAKGQKIATLKAPTVPLVVVAFDDAYAVVSGPDGNRAYQRDVLRAFDDRGDDSSDDEAAPPRRSPPAVRSPPPRPRADDDELAYFRSQGARNASLHESSSSDDDDSLPRRSRSRERPAPRPSEVIVID